VFMTGRRATVVSSAAALLLTLAACGSSSGGASTPGGANNKSPIVIAASLGLTGGLSFYDGEFLKSIEFGVAHFNSIGGVDGRQLKLITSDDQTTLSEVVPAAQTLIAQHPAVLLTSVSPDFAVPEARAAQAAGQLVMGQTGPTTFGSGLGNLVFNVASGDPTEAAVTADFVEQKGWSKVVLVEDQAITYTTDVCSLFKQSYTRQNPSGVIADITYNSSTDTTFPSQVSAIRGAQGAQAVVLCGLTSGGPTLIKELRATGDTIPIFGMGGGLDGTDWAQGIPNLGTFYSSSVGATDPAGGSLYQDNPNPTQAAYITAFTAKYGTAGLQFDSFNGYVAVQLIVAAIERSGGSTNSETLASTLAKFTNVPTLVGPTTYTASCHVAIGRPLAITQIVNGQGEYVTTITPSPGDIPSAPC
jgi:branched-chain amino acid transport system substrate-binding protein